SEPFTNLLSSYGCYNGILGATRVDGSRLSLLDPIFTTCANNVTKTAVLNEDISDHFPTCMQVRTSKPTVPKQQIFARNFSARNQDTFKRRIEDFDWSYLFHISEANVAYNSFIEKYKQIYEDCFPNIEIRQAKNDRKQYIITK